MKNLTTQSAIAAGVQRCFAALSMTTSRAVLLFILSLLLLTTNALDAAYVSAVELAKANNLTYSDLSVGSGHSCKISGGGRDVIFFAGMKNVLVNGAARQLSEPVQWDGTAIMVPDDAAALFDAAPASTRAASTAPYVSTGGAALPEPPDRLSAEATVVIDPGHGGKDQGTHSGSLLEKDVNLDVATRVARYLREHGVKVVMTRTRDVALELDDRTDLANRINPDLFLSIHANWMPSSSLRGAMLLYPTEGVQYRAAARSDGSVPLSPEALGAGGPLSATAQKVAGVAAFESYRTSSIEAAYRLQAALDPITGLYESSGVMESPRNLHVLRETHCPAVIVEMDFLSNAVSARKLGTSAYRAQIAEAIGKATLSYLASVVDR